MRLTGSGMTANDMGRMVKRRMRDTGLSTRLSPHSFRVATVTNLLEQGIPLASAHSVYFAPTRLRHDSYCPVII